ncbi:UNVERIFIED_CONTAM: hypothetical protein FKN15_032704 [Acipenser sinensis]
MHSSSLRDCKKLLLENMNEGLLAKYEQTKDGYVRIGAFVNGVAEGEVPPFMEKVTAVRLFIHSSSPVWVLLSEFYSLPRYLKGMYAFGLVETNLYDRAEKMAEEGLSLNPGDAWSVHSIAHVHEMRAEVERGLKFMEQTENNWKGEYEAALTIFDNQISQSLHSSGAMLDACSMLYRLQMEGVNVGDRWKEVIKVTKPYAEDHVLVFNDLHFLMSSVGAKEEETTRRVMVSLQECVKAPGENYQHALGQDLGLPMCEALVEFDNGNYSRTVELLQPIQYQMKGIGGSDTQRDIFSQLLIHAALKSEDKSHQKLARSVSTLLDIFILLFFLNIQLCAHSCFYIFIGQLNYLPSQSQSSCFFLFNLIGQICW